jgi:ribosomal protein S21
MRERTAVTRARDEGTATVRDGLRVDAGDGLDAALRALARRVAKAGLLAALRRHAEAETSGQRRRRKRRRARRRALAAAEALPPPRRGPSRAARQWQADADPRARWSPV